MADRYWFGDGGNWSDTAHWGTASNGVGAPAAVPTSSDDVYFDANSFSNPGQTVTLDATANCLDMIWTGATNTPTLAGAAQLNIYGDTVFIAAMVFSATSQIIWRGTKNLTTNGLDLSTVNSPIITGNRTLLDAFNIGTATLTISSGIFNTNGQTMTCGALTGNSSNNCTITLGASTFNCTAWDFTGTGQTLTANTSTIKITGTGAFAGGGITTYNNVELNGSAHTISGNNTFATLTLKADATQTITFTDGTTQTVTTPVITGSVGKVKTLVGSSTAGWIITKAGGGIVTANYLTLSYSKGTPPRTWIAGVYGTDTIGNTGWLFGRDWAEKSGAGWWVIRRRGING